MVKDSPTDRMLTSRWGFLRVEIQPSPPARRRSFPSFSRAVELRGATLPGEKGVGPVQRQFGRRAGQVGLEDRAVAGIDHRCFETPLEKILRMADEILIQGIRLGHKKDGGFLLGPAHAAAPLPGVDDASRIPDQDADIQGADIDAQFQGAGGDHPQEFAAGELPLDDPALLREKPGPVGTDLFPEGRGRLLHPLVDQFGLAPTLGEEDRLLALGQAMAEQAGGHHRRADIRVDEQEMFGRRREAAFLDHGEGVSHQRPGKFIRPGNGGRTKNKIWVAPVKPADAPQTADDLDHVAAEDALVGMGLIDHHQPQVLEKFLPAFVKGKQSQVQHVRVGDDDRRRLLADLFTVAGLGCLRRRWPSGRRDMAARKAPIPPWPCAGPVLKLLLEIKTMTLKTGSQAVS